MADSKREIERKYEATPGTRLPDLTRVAGVSAVVHRGLRELDAVYYDTEDLRLAADSLTLRRRTGGDDAGFGISSSRSPPASATRSTPRSPTPCRTAWPGCSAPGSGTRRRSPSSGCSPPGTSTTCSTRTASCSPSSASTRSAPNGSPHRRTAPRPPGPRSRSSWRTTATPPSSTPSSSGSTRPAYGPRPRRRSWPGPWPRPPRRSSGGRRRAARLPRSRQATTFSPTYATRSRPSSDSTPPYAATSPTPCTG